MTDERTDADKIRLLAKRVMGWNWVPDGGYGYWLTQEGNQVPASWDPLDSITDAWMLVSRLKIQGWSFALWDVPFFSSVQPGPLAAFQRSVHPPDRVGGGEVAMGGGDSAARAISAAARTTLELGL